MECHGDRMRVTGEPTLNYVTMCRPPTNVAAKFIKMLKAILTDVQFWIPVGVLAVGVAMLAWLH
jgi:hypothetical protein